ncbi:MAG: imidazoleglycerol-phosphate dehydratase HisB [Spirochaetes bacterium]|jgi:imidazoleglycerol-phosphate dehydratase|nr:imidazoleglycerol-phosphate dehydratase HisB [Spirochaetota bacterium]
MERKAEIKRKTRETDITLKLRINCAEKSAIMSGGQFFNHMLNSMARHGRFYLELQCAGDYDVDDHHSIEDIGICMGKAFKKAISDTAGCVRFGDAVIPMDDALAMAAVDLSGRPYFRYTGPELRGRIGNFSEEMTIEFLKSFAHNADINLHVTVFHGENRHHIHEAIFKALGIALFKASVIDPELKSEVPSTKGVLYDNGD